MTAKNGGFAFKKLRSTRLGVFIKIQVVHNSVNSGFIFFGSFVRRIGFVFDFNILRNAVVFNAVEIEFIFFDFGFLTGKRSDLC